MDRISEIILVEIQVDLKTYLKIRLLNKKLKLQVNKILNLESRNTFRELLRIDENILFGRRYKTKALIRKKAVSNSRGIFHYKVNLLDLVVQMRYTPKKEIRELLIKKNFILDRELGEKIWC